MFIIAVLGSPPSVAIKTAHQAFIRCPAFNAIRGSHLRGLVQVTSDSTPTESPHIWGPEADRALFRIARCLFSGDTTIWPHLRSLFYLGALPSLAELHRSRSVGLSERVLIRVAQARRTYSIRLAVHIWADFKRRLRSRSFRSSLTVPRVHLPEHLSHLL